MIGSRITGAEITSLSSTIANGCPTFSDVACANLREPELLKRKLTIGSPDALVEAGLRVGQVAAGDQNLLLDDIGYLRRGRAHQHFGIGRHPARLRLIRRHGRIDHAEFHLGGLAEQFLQPARILQARHLDQDTVGALALDHRLDGAELVDAALDDLDRLFDGLADALGDGRLRHPEADQAAAGIADFEAALPAGAQQPAERLRQLAQLGQRGLQIGILDADLDAIGTRRRGRYSRSWPRAARGARRRGPGRASPS